MKTIMINNREVMKQKKGEYGETELEHGSNDGDYEEGLEMDNDKAQPQDEPDDDSQ